MSIKHPFMFVPVLAILNHFLPTAKFECESSECLLFLLVVDFFGFVLMYVSLNCL